MPTLDFFARRGLFVVERFFDAEYCRRLCTEVRSAATAAGTVELGGDYLVDETTLKAQRAMVSPDTYRHVATSPESPEHLRARKVAVVLFLNEESEQPDPDSYGSGALTFYGLIDEPPWRSMGF